MKFSRLWRPKQLVNSKKCKNFESNLGTHFHLKKEDGITYHSTKRLFNWY